MGIEEQGGHWAENVIDRLTISIEFIDFQHYAC